MKVFDQDLQPDLKQSRFSSLKIILGLILLVAMISQGRLDPSPLNLLSPAEGISNWLGLPGALVAGFFLDIFGWCGFLFPLSILLLKHRPQLSPRQAVLLDTMFILLLTIGFAQLSSSPDEQSSRFTGLLGSISNIHLHEFPGKLITLLIVIGFGVRYARHYQFNRQLFVSGGHFGALLLVLGNIIQRTVGKRMGNVGEKLKQRVSPFSEALKLKLSDAKDRIAKNWSAASGKAMDWILAVNPFHRMPIENPIAPGLTCLGEDAEKELERRRLLSRIVEEYERRSVAEA